MRKTIATTLLAVAFTALVGALFAFTIALFPWSLAMLAVPMLIVVCVVTARGSRP